MWSQRIEGEEDRLIIGKYFTGNGCSYVDIFSKIKSRIYLKIDMITLDNMVWYNDDVDETYDLLAVALLHALTEAKYREIQSKLIDVNVNSVPSHYLMTKRRLDIITLQYSEEEIDDTITTTILHQIYYQN